MALTRRLVELGRSARASATVKIRQPLARALVAASGGASEDMYAVCGMVLILLKMRPKVSSQMPHITNPART